MDEKKTGLKDAYALETPEDSRKLYAGWAGTYDDEFVADMDYQLPFHTADAFVAAGGNGHVLDVGAGTGLVAERLVQRGISPIDATDISPEMLDIAGGKKLYRKLFVSDVTQPMNAPTNTYKGIISAGTFTVGHVGPEAIDNLLQIAASGALFAIAINAAHYQAAGFDAKLAGLSGKIEGLILVPVAIYGDGADGAHAADKGLIAVFRKV
ncbi:MAG: class I SAM-dependent methyltransferase [Rhodobacteraceae bacterium]|nr:class I SAM-dependent methyltransferase [Paracoccaceae bacterium]